MAFIYTVYPDAIDSSDQLPVTHDGVTPVQAEVVNRQREAILAIEGELGINPSGIYTTVRARLDALEAGGSGGGIEKVSQDGVSIVSPATELNFTGSVTVTDAGGGVANILIEGGGGEAVQETLPAIDLQTEFTLSQDPHSEDTVMMFINGQKQNYGVDYTVSGTTVTYNAVIFPISSSDLVEFWYLIDGGSGSSTIIVEDEGIQVTSELAKLNFTGAGVTASLEAGTGDIEVNIPGGGGSQTLSQTLALGNTTNGNNIDLTGGSVIQSSDGYIHLNNDVYIPGKLTVDGLIDPTGMVFENQTSTPGGTPSAGKTTLWIKDSDGYAVLTDDAGNETVIGANTLAETLALGNESGGNSIIMSDRNDVITLADGIASGSGLNILKLTTGVDTSGTGGGVQIAPASFFDNPSATTGGSIFLNCGDSDTGAGGSFNFTGGNSNSSVGGGISVSSGDGTDGGDLNINLGTGNAGRGGGLNLTGGDGSTTGGFIDIEGGDGGTGNGGYVSITAGRVDEVGTSGSGGYIEIEAGDSLEGSAGAGNVNISAGRAWNNSTGPGGGFVITAGDSDESDGGNLVINAGSAFGASGDGGDISISAGTSSGATAGVLTLSTSNTSYIQVNSPEITGVDNTANANDTSDIVLKTGDQQAGGSSGSLTLQTGAVSSGTGGTGDITILTPANFSATGQTGSISLSTGSGNAGSSGGMSFATGSGDTGNSGGITFVTGDAGSGASGDAGDMEFTTGYGAAAGSSGSFIFKTGGGPGGYGGDFTATLGNQFGAPTPGSFSFTAGNSNSAVDGGSVTFTTGSNSATGDGGGFDVFLGAGAGGANDGVFTVHGDGYVTGDFGIAGKLTVDGLIDPTGLVLTEQAAAPYDTTSTGTEGMIWVRDDGELVYTNQSGTDNVLGSGGGSIGTAVVGSVTTTDGYDTVVATFNTADDDKVYSFIAEITGRDAFDGYSGVYQIKGAFERTSGVVTQIGSTLLSNEQEEDLAWDVNFNITGTSINIVVSGDDVNSVNWSAFGNVKILGETTISASSTSAFAQNDILILGTLEQTQDTGFAVISAFELDPGDYGNPSSIVFRTLLETSNAADSAEVRLYNATTSTEVASSVLSTTSVNTVLLTADIASDIAFGSNIYELQIRLTTTGSPNSAICKRAELRLS